jgi:hypothetical protein
MGHPQREGEFEEKRCPTSRPNQPPAGRSTYRLAGPEWPARPAQIATGSYHDYARLSEEHILQADQGCDFDFLLR